MEREIFRSQTFPYTLTDHVQSTKNNKIRSILAAQASSEIENIVTISQELLTLPILYLSRCIIQHKADCYRLLRNVTRNAAWEGWILFMLNGVRETSLWTVSKIAAIRTLQVQTADYVRKAAPKIYSHELVNRIFEMPYCRIQHLTAREIAGRQTASTYLKGLVKIGVLNERAFGREKLFIHPRLTGLVTRDSNVWAPFP